MKSYFGGKSRAANLIWNRLGNVYSYIEPFFGTGAVLLRNPYGKAKREIVNDIDGLLVNFWRGIKHAPNTVAYWADYPTSHIDLTARKQYLYDRINLVEDLLKDPDWFDAKCAGYWVWVVSNSIGMSRDIINQKSTGEMPVVHSGASGKGVSMQKGKIPAIIPHNTGKGVSMQRGIIQENHTPLSGERLINWFDPLSKRLENVIILRKDARDLNSRTVSGTVKSYHITGWFIDPPYSTQGRGSTYRIEDFDIAQEMKRWSVQNGENPQYRIALAGYRDDYVDFPEGWTCESWSRDSGKMGSGDLAKYSREEVIWFSPHCIMHEKEDENNHSLRLF